MLSRIKEENNKSSIYTMKKYRLQEGLAWICFKCKKKILSTEDIVWYERRLYHQKCALTLLEKLKRKLFGGKK